ncbi:ABC transporter permease [Hydrogenoanaerobacterium sp.]|uniref:ABC transporter permease n=1 Tax=Hydrogenoanaerobacterium sp. TaxID=2953763 RepID=UPI00289C018F|nr:ABC transporter permease [Hydrogenoanaerobacterium sp.]
MNLEVLFSMNTLLLILRLAVPIILVALSSTISELGGIISLGTEGMMLIGAFGAVAGSYFTNSGWLGMLIGAASSAAIALFYGLLCVRFKANQTVCGVGLNLFGLGATAVGTFLIWGQEGISAQVTQLPNITIPLLSDIPVLGKLFKNQSPILYLTFALAGIAWYIIRYTKTGLRLRAVSAHPIAVRSVGVNVEKYRYAALAISGALAGIGGGFLSIVQNNVFVNNMTAGRGFLGVAANIFGGWSPIGSLGSSFIFAAAQSVRFNMLEAQIPDQFVQMLPYAITIIALILFGKRVKSPKALGVIE